jgi:hypothetical protein
MNKSYLHRYAYINYNSTNIEILLMIFSAITTLILALIAEQTQNNWIFWATIISVLILIVATIITVARFLHSKWIIRMGNAYNIYFHFSGLVNNEKQYILLSIKSKIVTNLKFICLSFEGQPKPSISGLFDCISGRILEDTPISIHSVINDAVIWKYDPPLEKPDISYSVAIIAKMPFNGILRVDLASQTPNRSIYDIPISINEKQVTYAGKGKYKGSVPIHI